MAVAVAEQLQVGVRERAIGWIQEAVEAGTPLPLACELARNRIAAERLIEAAWEELGAETLAHVWRKRNADSRRSIQRSVRRSGPEEPVFVEPNPPLPVQGERRVDVSILRQTGNVMEALFPVDGKWVRLGHLTRADVLTLAKQRRKEAHANARQAKLFLRLAKGMTDGQRVEHRYSPAEVLKIVKEALS